METLIVDILGLFAFAAIICNGLIVNASKRLKKVRLMREIQILDDQDQFVDFDSSFTAKELLN